MADSKKRIWNKDFIILFFVNIIGSLGMMMLNPNMAEYAKSLGASVGMLGTVAAVFAAAALAARPFSGSAADRFDNKMLIIISLVGITVSLFLYSLAAGITLMLVFRFIHGLFFGLNSTLSMTMASRSLPEEKMGAGMGIFGLGMVLSMTIAPSLGIYISERFGFTQLFYVASAASTVATILVLFLKKQPKLTPKTTGMPYWMTFFAPEAISPSAIAMLNSCAFATVQTFLLLFAKERGIGDIGIYFTVNALALLVFRPLISRFMDKVPLKYIIYPCSLSMIASMLVIATAHSLWALLVAAVLFGFGNGGSQPALQTLALKSVPNERRGASSGTYFIGMDMGNIIGPIIAGVAASFVGYGGSFAFMIVPVILGIGVMFITDRHQKAKAQSVKAQNT